MLKYILERLGRLLCLDSFIHLLIEDALKQGSTLHLETGHKIRHLETSICWKQKTLHTWLVDLDTIVRLFYNHLEPLLACVCTGIAAEAREASFPIIDQHGRAYLEVLEVYRYTPLTKP